jgi:adenosylcobinamide kinase/adenosylcobinamide-phosphate guanylyltransferase
MIELFLGGTRSGKSRLAEQCAVKSALEVVYIATATADDSQMQTRISQHQHSRPDSWALIEEPLYLGATIENLCAAADKPQCLLVDCLTLWLSNCLFKQDLAFYQQQKAHLLQVLEKIPATIIFVSNETNMGVIPMGEVSREFCDQAGLLHQEIAALSHKVTLAVAGLAHVLKG